MPEDEGSDALSFSLIFDMRVPPFAGPPERHYAAAIDQARWADRLGFELVELREHHASRDGYLPSPAVLASAMAAVTDHVLLWLNLVLLPLHDPVRVAEDLAVLDLISGGRLRLVVGAGYREEEYLQFGKSIKRRPSLMEEGIEVLKQAWTGEPFEHRGAAINVLPRPMQRPRPAIVMGGASPAAAKRAARIADGFNPVAPGLMRPYLEELAAQGKPQPSDVTRPRVQSSAVFTHVATDVEGAWNAIAPHAMWETNEYAAWANGGRGTPYVPFDTIDDLRASGTYRVVTPTEAVAIAHDEGGLRLHPLMGGLDPEVAWTSLRLIEEQVLPVLRAEA